MEPIKDKIIFFDGFCHLCNRYIDFLSQVDSSKKIYYASLQGQTARHFLSETDIKNLDTVIYFKNGQKLIKSTAVIESLSDASTLFKLLKIFYIIPEFIRNIFYNFVATHRYRLFGQRETCRIPTPEERKKILD